MIYNREEGEVTILGDVQKYKVSIDEKNINHIVTILSSNLYSYPMISFLRETVSNAVDSHIEAKTEEPIVIYRTNNDISIRDYGTGISPERFQEIYINIGSSTKRTSNNYIGNFGIGRFSALSVADLVNVTSFYHGKAYYYVMNKDIDQLHIDLLYEKTTTEHDGVEVKVPIKTWNTNTLRCLSFIDNLYVESDLEADQSRLERFNQREIISYKNFKIISKTFDNEYQDTEILFGKIPYTVNYNSLWEYDDMWHASWERCFKYIYPQLEIGDLDITPNRESLLYSERTKETLRKKYDECIDELTEMWTAQCNTEYTDLWQYISDVVTHSGNTLIIKGNYVLPISNNLSYNAVYKSRPEWNDVPSKDKLSILNCIWTKDIEVLGKFQHGDLFQGYSVRGSYQIRRLHNEHWFDWENKMVLALPNRAGFTSQYFKGFVTEKYKKDYILLLKQFPETLSHRHIKSLLRSTFLISDYKDAKSRRFMFQLVREMINYISDKVVVTNVMDSKEYAQYKKDNTIKREFKHTENIRFSIYTCEHEDAYNISLKTSEVIGYVRKELSCKKHRIVYTDIDNPFISAFVGLGYRNLVILAVSAGKVDALKEDMPDWIRPIEELYSEDNRILQKYAAIQYIVNKPHLYIGRMRFMPNPIQDAVRILEGYKDKYSFLGHASWQQKDDAKQLLKVVPEEKYDRTIMALYHNTKRYMNIAYLLYSTSEVGLETYFILMKQKRFRINFNYYVKIRERINYLTKLYESN